MAIATRAYDRNNNNNNHTFELIDRLTDRMSYCTYLCTRIRVCVYLCLTSTARIACYNGHYDGQLQLKRLGHQRQRQQQRRRRLSTCLCTLLLCALTWTDLSIYLYGHDDNDNGAIAWNWLRLTDYCAQITFYHSPFSLSLFLGMSTCSRTQHFLCIVVENLTFSKRLCTWTPHWILLFSSTWRQPTSSSTVRLLTSTSTITTTTASYYYHQYCFIYTIARTHTHTNTSAKIWMHPILLLTCCNDIHPINQNQTLILIPPANNPTTCSPPMQRRAHTYIMESFYTRQIRLLRSLRCVNRFR